MNFSVAATKPWDFLRSNWVAIVSLSGWVSTWIAYQKLKRDTRPALHVSHVTQMPHTVEIENVGPTVVVNLALGLIERTRRPSGRLSTVQTLRPGERAQVSAYACPHSLSAEVEATRYLPPEHTILRLSGKDTRISGPLMAEYLLTRDGGQLLTLRYRVADSTKTCVRMFSTVRRGDGFVDFKPRRTMSTRPYVRLPEVWNKHNPEFAAPFTWPSTQNPQPENLSLSNRSGRRTAGERRPDLDQDTRSGIDAMLSSKARGAGLVRHSLAPQPVCRRRLVLRLATGKPDTRCRTPIAGLSAQPPEQFVSRAPCRVHTRCSRT
jgi:hypothetical protein